MKKYQDNDHEDRDVNIFEMFEMLADQLEAIVQETLTRPSPEPARLFAGRVIEIDQFAIENGNAVPDEFGGAKGEPGVSMAFAILATWISGAKEDLDDSDLAGTVLSWITTHLGESIAALAVRGAWLLGAPDASNLTIHQLADELGREFIPVMIWLTTGLAATYDSGGTSSLRFHDTYLNKPWTTPPPALG